MNIQTHISEKIELHGPLSFSRKNLEEQARGFPRSFSHVTWEQEPEAPVGLLVSDNLTCAKAETSRDTSRGS